MRNLLRAPKEVPWKDPGRIAGRISGGISGKVIKKTWPVMLFEGILRANIKESLAQTVLRNPARIFFGLISQQIFEKTFFDKPLKIFLAVSLKVILENFLAFFINKMNF